MAARGLWALLPALCLIGAVLAQHAPGAEPKAFDTNSAEEDFLAAEPPERARRSRLRVVGTGNAPPSRSRLAGEVRALEQHGLRPLVVVLNKDDGWNLDDISKYFELEENTQRRGASVSPQQRRGRPPAPARAAPAHLTPPPEPEVPDPLPPTMVPSSTLVKMFRSQKAHAPELPPIVVPGVKVWLPQPPRDLPVCEVSTKQLATPAASADGAVRAPATRTPPRTPPPRAPAAPAQPSLTRSLAMRGWLTVERAGYTEAYTALWDARTGSMKMTYYDGSFTVYRHVNGSKVTRVARQLDRAGTHEMRRCVVMASESAAPVDRAPPALPDMQNFQFADYVTFEGVSAERWTYTTAGGAGEQGGARSEALTFRHELRLVRSADNAVTPLQYTVEVDSSALGVASDRYVHRYQLVRHEEPAPDAARVDLAAACDDVRTTADLHQVDPMLEFTSLQRDSRYDNYLLSFVSNYKRRYNDDTEEAVRKNLIVQSTRFSEAGNRVGATFSVAVNKLGDRLESELEALAGAHPYPGSLPPQPFPYTRIETREIHDSKLPAALDWRARGAVTGVRDQGLGCASCWAFAAVGAVEGALYRTTGRLVPLSEQALVDCAGPYGGNGCNNTWSTFAFDYTRERGLPARSAYTPYQAMELKCRDTEVKPVTHITTHVNITKLSTQALKVALWRFSPAVVLVNVAPTSFKQYAGGVYADKRCNDPSDIKNHAMLVVGWERDRHGKEHFIVKNSWGRWGEAGYVRLPAAGNMCGLLRQPIVPLVQPGDSDDHNDNAHYTDDDDQINWNSK